MIKESVLRDFPNWDSEKQLSEYQAYKAMGDYSPFNEADYQLMEMVMNNPNAEVSVECEDGVCSIVSSEEDLSVLLEASDSITVSSVFNNLLSNQKVKNFIKEHKEKHKLLKIYKTILPTIEDKKLKNDLNTIFSKIKSPTAFTVWEKIVVKKLPTFSTKLNKLGMISTDIDNDDFIVFNLNKISLNAVKRHTKLSALLLLNLTSALSVTDRKTFFEDLTLALEGDKDVNSQKDVDEKDFNDDVDIIDTENADMEENNGDNDEYDLDDVMKELSLDTFEADKWEFNLNYKGLGANTSDTLANTGNSGLSYLIAKNPDLKAEDFDPSRGANKMYEFYLSGEIETLGKTKRENQNALFIATSLQNKSLEQFKSDIDTLLESRSKLEVMGALKLVAIDSGIKIIGRSLDDTLSNFLDEIRNDTGDIIDGLEIKTEKYNHTIKEVDERVKALNIEKNNTVDTTNINNKLIQKMIKLSESVSEPFDFNEMSELFDEIDSVVSLEERQFPHPTKIPEIINSIWSFMKDHSNDKVKKLGKRLATDFKTGEGVGEKFIEFALPFAYSGGQSSFDIKIAKQAYEIKTYNVDGNTISDSIRLGQEGNIFKSESFARMFTLILDLQIVFDDSLENFELLNIMLKNAISKDKFDKISFLLNNPAANKKMGGRASPLSLVQQLRKGEFSNSNINVFHGLMKLVSQVLTSIVENEFYFMKIFLKDTNIDLAIKPIGVTEEKLKTIKKNEEINFEVLKPFNKKSQKKLKNTIMRILGNREIIQNPDYLKVMVEDGMSNINSEFEKHPMILLNDLRKESRETLCSGIHTNFTFDQITQSGFKIIPAGLIKKKST